MVDGHSGVTGQHVTNSVVQVCAGGHVNVATQLHKVTAGTVKVIQWRDKNAIHIHAMVSYQE